MMYLKIYKTGQDVLVAVCDCELQGRTFTEGELSLEVSAGFFGDEKVSLDVVEKALLDASIANIVGERAVACAARLDCIDKENVLLIDGIPCAQMVRM
jgi:hypothetical protein